MSEVVNIFKQLAVEAVEATKPCEISFGLVVSDLPVAIRLNEKITLTEDQLIFTDNVMKIERDITLSMETEETTIDKLVHKHDFSGTTGVYDYYDEHNKLIFSHNHSFRGATGANSVEDISHKHSIKGVKKIIIHNELKTGEEVLLLRCSNGQKYVVLDRIGACICKGEWLDVT